MWIISENLKIRNILTVVDNFSKNKVVINSFFCKSQYNKFNLKYVNEILSKKAVQGAFAVIFYTLLVLLSTHFGNSASCLVFIKSAPLGNVTFYKKKAFLQCFYLLSFSVCFKKWNFYECNFSFRYCAVVFIEKVGIFNTELLFNWQQQSRVMSNGKKFLKILLFFQCLHCWRISAASVHLSSPLTHTFRLH